MIADMCANPGDAGRWGILVQYVVDHFATEKEMCDAHGGGLTVLITPGGSKRLTFEREKHFNAFMNAKEFERGLGENTTGE